MPGVVDFPRVRSPHTSRYQEFGAYPDTEAGWADRYDRLRCAYLQDPYDAGELKEYHLFRAIDDSGQVIDQANRLFGLYRFVVDTDVGGLLGGKLALKTTKDVPEAVRPKAQAAGEAVWKRSHVDEQIEKWAKGAAKFGDYYIEAVRTSKRYPFRTTLVGYDPRNVLPVYDDETGTRLVRVIVTTHYQDEPTIGSDGVTDEGALHTYRREIDATTIQVWRDGRPVPEESGPHRAGVVPCVHLQWAPGDEPEHGLPAPLGLDLAVMRMDSLIAQFGAISNRYANPMGVVKGAKLGVDADIAQFGRWISGLPADGSVEYLEAGGEMLAHILAGIRLILEHAEKTEPEFLFADTGNVSGEARSYKAAALENKIGNARMRIFGELARVIGYAVAMDADLETDPDACPYVVEAPPILPRNTKGELEALELLKGDMKRADRVRHGQRLGFITPDQDPEAYAAEVLDENAARAAAFFTEPEDDETEDPAKPKA